MNENTLRKEEMYYVPNRIHIYVKDLEKEIIYVTANRDWRWSVWKPWENENSFRGHYRLRKSHNPDDPAIHVAVFDRDGEFYHSFYLRENGLYRITVDSDKKEYNHRVIMPIEESLIINMILREWNLPTNIVCERPIRTDPPDKFKNIISRCKDIPNIFWCSDGVPLPTTPPHYEKDRNNPDYFQLIKPTWAIKVHVDKEIKSVPKILKVVTWENQTPNIASLARTFYNLGLKKPEPIILPP